jgi:hypothetical protein
MLKFKLLLLSTIFLIGCSTSKSTMGDDMKLIQEKTFSVTSDAYLTVKTAAGKIKISTWDKNEVNVKIYANENTEGSMDFDISQGGVDVNVDGKMKQDNEKNNNNLNVRYEITTPKLFNIEADTKGGNVEVLGLDGSKNVNTMGGDVNIENGEGMIDANTMGGNIHIVMSNGKIKANTMGGNISLEYKGVNKGIELNTMGGNIHASLPPDIDGNADVSTMAGKISCDFAQPVNNFASSSLNAKFNNGGEPIKITTAAGSINIEKK